MAAAIPQLGPRLKQVREWCGRSVADVAVLTGMTTQHIYGLERGDHNAALESLVALARVYQVDVADFFAFPAQTKLRHRARDLIRRVPDSKLDELVEAMERVSGTSWADLEQELAMRSPRTRASR
jgi:transcriptional regulator with XRE-family HTH domain